MKNGKLRREIYVFDDNHELYVVFSDEENNIEREIEKYEN